MTRASKPEANDGMSWVALMPFPAFTPLNWWALASPQNAMAATINATRVALDAWRAGADGMRAIVRLQQDEALKLLETSLSRADAPAHDAETEHAEAEAGADALLLRPMMEATRAYGRVGRAFIVAQRDTLRAFSPPQQPN
jgi:hypothetical protein